MQQHNNVRRALLLMMSAAALAFLAAFALSGRPTHSQPRALDVPYVPTPEHIVEAMLRLAKPTKDDYLVDLGCGDGRIPIAAALQFGTRGLCVDLNPQRIKEARANAAKAGVTDKVELIEGDLFKTDFKKASVLTLYLLPSVNMRLRGQILEMKPGTRVVSHAFNMEDWKADAVEKSDFRTVYFWIVPAQVAGRWSGTLAGRKIEIELRQQFQELDGIAKVDGATVAVSEAKVVGEEVGFAIGMPDGRSSRIVLRAQGDRLEGEGGGLVRL